MITKITHVTIWVKDQDEALKFYRDQLGFKVVSDDATTIPNYRWLRDCSKITTAFEPAAGWCNSIAEASYASEDSKPPSVHSRF